MGIHPMPSLFDIVPVMPRSLFRKLSAVPLVASLVWFASAWGQSPPAPAPEASAPLSFKVLADQVVALFPIIEADVVEVTGTRVILSAGRAQAVQPGVELIGYREGRELIHPRTKQVLGRTEETLGRIVVAEVFENYAVARHIDGPVLKAGDKARVTAGKIRL